MGKANDLYDKAIELSKRFDERFLDLGRTLRDLRAADQELFRLCIENSQVSVRTGYYLIEVIGRGSHRPRGIGVATGQFRDAGAWKCLTAQPLQSTGRDIPDYKSGLAGRRASRFLTLETCHWPPRAVLMPRLFRAMARPRRLVTPAF
jgi:hypothetical protein